MLIMLLNNTSSPNTIWTICNEAGAVDEVRDFGVGAFKGVIGIGDVAVGLADTAAASLTGLSDSLTGLSDGENNVRNTLANRDGLIGFDPQRAKKIADEKKKPQKGL